MRDEVRGLHAMLWLTHIFLNTGNLERAAAQLESARRLAMMLGDEARAGRSRAVRIGRRRPARQIVSRNAAPVWRRSPRQARRKQQMACHCVRELG